MDPEAAVHIWRIISGYEWLLPKVLNIYVHIILALTQCMESSYQPVPFILFTSSNAPGSWPSPGRPRSRSRISTWAAVGTIEKRERLSIFKLVSN